MCVIYIYYKKDYVSETTKNTKDDFLRVLFAAFVKNNRLPNKRLKRVQYWIHSQYKHLTHHPERDNEKKKIVSLKAFVIS